MHPQDRNRCLVLGDKRIPLGRTLGTPREKGIIPICPTCGNAWARVELGCPDPRGEYIIARWLCEEHGTHLQAGGSIWKLLIWWDRGLAPTLGASAGVLSPEFLEREILCKAAQLLGVTVGDLYANNAATHGN